MQIVFTAAEQGSTRQFNRKLGRLLRELPGADKIANELVESSYEPINFEKINREIDTSQFKISEGDEGSLVVWINPEATSAAMDLALEQYGVVIEIGIALYPIARLTKRLLTGLSEKFIGFGKRFERKPNPMLGKVVPVRSGGFEGNPVVWKEGTVVAAHGENVIVRYSASQQHVLAKQDGQLFYADSPEIESVLKFFELEILSDKDSWTFVDSE